MPTAGQRHGRERRPAGRPWTTLIGDLKGYRYRIQHSNAKPSTEAGHAHWGVLYAAIIPETSSAQPHVEPTPPPRTQREEFFIGDTVSFTDKHLSERVGVVVRLNAKTASVAVNDTDGHWRVSYSLLRKIVDI